MKYILFFILKEQGTDLFLKKQYKQHCDIINLGYRHRLNQLCLPRVFIRLYRLTGINHSSSSSLPHYDGGYLNFFNPLPFFSFSLLSVHNIIRNRLRGFIKSPNLHLVHVRPLPVKGISFPPSWKSESPRQQQPPTCWFYKLCKSQVRYSSRHHYVPVDRVVIIKGKNQLCYTIVFSYP